MSKTIPVLWTNDDIYHGRSRELRRQLEFLDRHSIPGVFYVIPRQGSKDQPEDLDKDDELIALINAAKLRGHEFYQHGFCHHAFECGVPELGMLEIDRQAWRRFDEDRASLEAMHTLEAQMEMLQNGQRIWHRAFGEDSKGFRPGWFAYCGNFYKALASLGYQWVSSRMPCMTSWAWNNGEWGKAMDFRDAIPSHPHLLEQGIWEYPIAGDYAYRVPNDAEKINAMVDLGLREFEVFYERGHPMQIVSHFHGLEFPGSKDKNDPNLLVSGTGYAVHDKLIPALKATGRVEFINMSTLVKRYQNL